MDVGSAASRETEMIHALAKLFIGIHWVIGITTLPADASRQQERSFVRMWLGIVAFIGVWFAVLLYLLR
jgi:hypothetical protein